MENLETQSTPIGYSKMQVFWNINLNLEKMIEDTNKWLKAHEIIFIDSCYRDVGLNINKILFKTRADFYIEFIKHSDIITTHIYHRPTQINEVIFYIKQLNKLNLNYGD
jgi:hypothetical protein